MTPLRKSRESPRAWEGQVERVLRPLLLAQDLLVAEVDHLERYNRLLEGPTDEVLTDILCRLRDEQVLRISLLQGRIQSIRSTLEV